MGLMQMATVPAGEVEAPAPRELLPLGLSQLAGMAGTRRQMGHRETILVGEAVKVATILPTVPTPNGAAGAGRVVNRGVQPGIKAGVRFTGLEEVGLEARPAIPEARAVPGIPMSLVAVGLVVQTAWLGQPEPRGVVLGPAMAAVAAVVLERGMRTVEPVVPQAGAGVGADDGPIHLPEAQAA